MRLAVEPKSAATLAAAALEDRVVVELREVVATRELELRLVARETPEDPPPEVDTPLSSPPMEVADTDGPLELELLELLEVDATLATEAELDPPPPLRREL
jgi:hypothetical protein